MKFFRGFVIFTPRTLYSRQNANEKVCLQLVAAADTDATSWEY